MIVNIAIVAVLLLVALGGIRTLIKNIHGESCCSGGNTEVPVKPADKNKKNYPYKYTVIIEGMKCINCAKRIQNKLNANGMWAKVNFKKSSAEVLFKKKDSEELMKKIVSDAGYKIIDYKEL